MKTAYSYIRWSDIRQSDGDSQRRQEELRDSWLKGRPDVALDKTLKLVSRGVGAFTGSHRSDKHALGQFISQVESGRVKPGSYLLIENLDRLSREDVHDAVELLLRLTRLGVIVVQLSPVVCEFAYPVEMSRLIIAVVELARGNSESRMKSDRVKQAWRSARERAKSGDVITTTVPGWCEVRDGKIKLLKDRAAVVRRCHQLAQQGYGVNLIVKQLNAEKVKPWGRAALWSEAVVYRFLTSRSVLGEWQPGSGGRGGVKREKVGEPVPGYFPRVIEDDVWHATQAAIAKRHGFRGARGKHTNLLAGLLFDALGRGKLGYSHEKRGSYLFNFAGRVSGGDVPMITYPAPVLERQILSVLREIDPAVVVGDDGAGAAVLAGEGRLKEIDTQLAEIEERMLAGSKVSLLERVAAKLEGERAAVADQLEKDRQRAAVPSAVSWSVVKETVDLTDEAVRMRLRSAIRDVVEGIWCVFAAHKSGRYRAWVQIVLPGGYWRDLQVWADVGDKRWGGRPAADGFFDGNNGSKQGPGLGLAALIPERFGKVSPVLALEDGPKWAADWRDSQMRLLRGEGVGMPEPFAEPCEACGQE